MKKAPTRTHQKIDFFNLVFENGASKNIFEIGLQKSIYKIRFKNRASVFLKIQLLKNVLEISERVEYSMAREISTVELQNATVML